MAMHVRCTRRIISIALPTVVTLLLSALTLLVPGEDKAHAAPLFECSRDVQFFGAAGSGQNPNQNDSLGPEVSAAYAKLGNRLSGLGRSIGLTPVNYPAKPVFGSLIGGNLVEYFEGLNQGVTETLNALASFSRAAECNHQRIVLAGYSQGAMVMHRVLRELEHPAYLSLRDRIDGALLIGDGDKVPSDRVKRFGSAGATTQGVGLLYPEASGTRSTKFDSRWSTRIKSICNAPDLVCALSRDNPLPVAIQRGGDRTHGAYSENGAPDITKALNDIRFRFPSDAPVLSAGSERVVGHVGTRIFRRLEAKSGNGCAVTWQPGTGVRLPAGLNVAPDGVVVGTPTQKVDRNYTLKLTANCRGRKSATSNVRVRFSISDAPPTAPSTPTKPPTPTGMTVVHESVGPTRDLAVDRLDRLYITEVDRGVVRYDPITKTSQLMGSAWGPVRVSSIAVDDRFNIYAMVSGPSVSGTSVDAITVLPNGSSQWKILKTYPMSLGPYEIAISNNGFLVTAELHQTGPDNPGPQRRIVKYRINDSDLTLGPSDILPIRDAPYEALTIGPKSSVLYVRTVDANAVDNVVLAIDPMDNSAREVMRSGAPSAMAVSYDGAIYGSWRYGKDGGPGFLRKFPDIPVDIDGVRQPAAITIDSKNNMYMVDEDDRNDSTVTVYMFGLS